MTVQIYANWASFYITTFLGSKASGPKLSAAGTSKLVAETETNVKRLLTICEMLLKEHRLDQICFLLQFLDVIPNPETQKWYASRVKNLANEMKKKKGQDRALKDWHVAVADRLLTNLKTAKESGRDRWGWRAGVKVVVGDDGYELHKMKED